MDILRFHLPISGGAPPGRAHYAHVVNLVLIFVEGLRFSTVDEGRGDREGLNAASRR